jgi:hypothetical protein
MDWLVGTKYLNATYLGTPTSRRAVKYREYLYSLAGYCQPKCCTTLVRPQGRMCEKDTDDNWVDLNELP